MRLEHGPQLTPGTRRHAVVVGGSIGGLLAARTLSTVFSDVTVIDRDTLPVGLSARRDGVPQDKHAHALLPRGAQILDSMFPGLLSELAEAGAPVCDNWVKTALNFGGHRLPCDDRAIHPAMYQPSRPLLENLIRARVGRLAGVRLRPRTDAVSLTVRGAERTVDGVSIVCDGVQEHLSADLVVDATGRRARSTRWLQQLGMAAPTEENLRIDLVYVTVALALDEADTGPLFFAVTAPRPDDPSGVALVRVEGNRWICTLSGYGRHAPPTLADDFCKRAAQVLPAPIGASLTPAKFETAPVRYRFVSNSRRRFDELPHFPAGLMMFGDALCSVNPLYGQGMTISAMQAEALRETLLDVSPVGSHFPREFFKRAAKSINLAWDLATTSDLSFREVCGHRSLKVRALNSYVAHVQRAAVHDSRVADRFVRTTGFLDNPLRLFTPMFAARVAAGQRGPRTASMAG
jgi:2-polyprenyl-6-methoxyphenol hydroxylase-like FAD-dependent oxidoreductase